MSVQTKPYSTLIIRKSRSRKDLKMLIVCWSFEQPRFAGLSANCYDEWERHGDPAMDGIMDGVMIRYWDRHCRWGQLRAWKDNEVDLGFLLANVSYSRRLVTAQRKDKWRSIVQVVGRRLFQGHCCSYRRHWRTQDFIFGEGYKFNKILAGLSLWYQ